eukprot:622296-Pleurochrysis_carterae.AAC.4
MAIFEGQGLESMQVCRVCYLAPGLGVTQFFYLSTRVRMRVAVVACRRGRRFSTSLSTYVLPTPPPPLAPRSADNGRGCFTCSEAQQGS